MARSRQSRSETHDRRRKFKKLLDSRMKAAGIEPSALAKASNGVLRSRNARRSLTPQQVSQFRRTPDPEWRVPRHPELLHALCEGLERLKAWVGEPAKRATEVSDFFSLLGFDLAAWFPDIAGGIEQPGESLGGPEVVAREPTTQFVDALMAQSRLIFCSTVLNDPADANILRLQDARSVFYGQYLMRNNAWIGVSRALKGAQSSNAQLNFDELPALFRAYASAVPLFADELERAGRGDQIEMVLKALQRHLHLVMLRSGDEFRFCCCDRVYFLCLRRSYGRDTSLSTAGTDWPTTFRRATWTPDLLGEYVKDADLFEPRRGLQLGAVAGRTLEVEHAPGAPIAREMVKWLRDVLKEDHTCCYRFLKFDSVKTLCQAIDTREPIFERLEPKNTEQN